MRNKYISDHDVLYFYVCVDEALFVHVWYPVEQLSQYFYHLFFFEYFEFSLQSKQRLFRVLHYQVDVRKVAVKVVQWNQIIVVKGVLDFDFVYELF